MDPFTAIGVGLSLYESISDSTAGEEFEHGMRTEVQKQQSLKLQQQLLGEQETWLKRVSGKRQQLTTDIYGRDARSLVDRLNLGVRNLIEQYESGSQRSGFAYSGTLAHRYSKSREEEELSYLKGRESLYDQYKTTLMNLQQFEQKGLIDIASQQKMINLETQQSIERQNQYVSDFMSEVSPVN